jgi:hypothetical protein
MAFARNLHGYDLSKELATRIIYVLNEATLQS